jgi:hypothetical protein
MLLRLLRLIRCRGSVHCECLSSLGAWVSLLNYADHCLGVSSATTDGSSDVLCSVYIAQRNDCKASTKLPLCSRSLLSAVFVSSSNSAAMISTSSLFTLIAASFLSLRKKSLTESATDGLQTLDAA